MNVIVFLIRICLYLVVVSGLIMLVTPTLQPFLQQAGKTAHIRFRKGIRVFGEKAIDKKKKKDWFYSHLDRLLFLAAPDYQPGISVVSFITRVILLFVSFFVVGMLTIGEIPDDVSFSSPFSERAIQMENQGDKLVWEFPFILALFSALAPYFRLRYRYARRSIQASYDLLDVVKILSKHTNYSIDAALHKTSELLDQRNVLKRPLRVLGNEFSSYEERSELIREVHRFSGLINTTFGMSFCADLLYLEKEGGTYLRDSLLHLTREMESQRATILSVKANSSDAIALGTWGNLLVLIIMMGSIAFLLKWHVFIRLQFQTTIGLGFLSFIIVMMFIAFFVSSILSKPRLDYH